ncbi:hypothetical protein NP590_08550 [Methylomonas sp. SURF-2]|uniref:Uncharacterized protein n=1 Tax=Methylomonas subterranea TaxID=2952225 RepID=A0ABT1TFA2_9GAMM|nr:hypothetical protein [Methylomonas sp. SURF-2]MCQ8104151.1 hypothetical protein [Methylomonas sp. SURF-2]
MINSCDCDALDQAEFFDCLNIGGASPKPMETDWSVKTVANHPRPIVLYPVYRYSPGTKPNRKTIASS